MSDESAGNSSAQHEHFAPRVALERAIRRLAGQSLIADQPKGLAGTQFHRERFINEGEVTQQQSICPFSNCHACVNEQVATATGAPSLKRGSRRQQ
jgi:hypothetical protein